VCVRTARKCELVWKTRSCLSACVDISGKTGAKKRESFDRICSMSKKRRRAEPLHLPRFRDALGIGPRNFDAGMRGSTHLLRPFSLETFNRRESSLFRPAVLIMTNCAPPTQLKPVHRYRGRTLSVRGFTSALIHNCGDSSILAFVYIIK